MAFGMSAQQLSLSPQQILADELQKNQAALAAKRLSLDERNQDLRERSFMLAAVRGGATQPKKAPAASGRIAPMIPAGIRKEKAKLDEQITAKKTQAGRRAEYKTRTAKEAKETKMLNAGYVKDPTGKLVKPYVKPSERETEAVPLTPKVKAANRKLSNKVIRKIENSPDPQETIYKFLREQKDYAARGVETPYVLNYLKGRKYDTKTPGWLSRKGRRTVKNPTKAEVKFN